MAGEHTHTRARDRPYTRNRHEHHENQDNGRIAVVTGAASGSGLATATLLAERGATVVLLDRDDDKLDRTKQRLAGHATAVRVDVSRPSDLQAAMSTVGERHGRIDTLFVNAGVAEEPSLLTLSEEDFDLMMGVNLKGAFFTFLTALPLLGRRSSAVFTSSVAEGRGRPAGPVYSASKAGVRSLVRTLAVHDDVLNKDIRVNAVTPGTVATPLTQQTPHMQAAVDDYARTSVPLGRTATAREIAQAVAFLTDPTVAAYITGTEIVVDGGMSQV